MNTRIHFISFADSKMFNTLLRIKQEAEISGFFNKVDIYTEQDFDPSFTERFGDLDVMIFFEKVRSRCRRFF